MSDTQNNQQVAVRDSEESGVVQLADDSHAGREVHASLAVSLARAEVDQQVATARALPRSIKRAINNIKTLATLDVETATECIYAVPRGGRTIRGPSIRFAEIAASQWGNCRVGARVVHVDRIEQYVEAEGIFHDLETNVAQTARVRRPIQAKKGKAIDNDMIQLAGAAASSIARRNAILAGIPKGITRQGYMAVEDILRGDVKTLAERRARMVKAFGVLGVAPERLFASLGVAGEEEVTLDHLLTLTGVHSAIKSGETNVDEAFPPIAKPGDKPKNLGDALDKVAGAGKTAEGVKEGETVDPQTGEVMTQGGSNGAPTGKETSDAKVERSSEPAGPGPSQGQQEGAGATGSAPALSEKDAAILADLIETGAGRAESGGPALRHFLDNLEPAERAMIPPKTIEAWVKIAKTVKPPVGGR
jgi:hypothetical protein